MAFFQLPRKDRSSLQGLAALSETFVSGDLRNRQMEITQEKMRAEKMLIRTTLGELAKSVQEPTLSPIDYNKKLDEASFKLLSHGGEMSKTVAEELGKRKRKEEGIEQLLGPPEEVRDSRIYSFGRPGSQGGKPVVTRVQEVDLGSVEERQARGQERRDLEEYTRKLSAALATQKEKEGTYGGEPGIQKVLQQATNHPQFAQFSSGSEVDKQRIIASLTGDVARTFKVADEYLRAKADVVNYTRLLRGKDKQFNAETGKLEPWKPPKDESGELQNKARGLEGGPKSRKDIEAQRKAEKEKEAAITAGTEEEVTKEDYEKAIDALTRSKGYTRQGAEEFLRKQGIKVR